MASPSTSISPSDVGKKKVVFVQTIPSPMIIYEEFSAADDVLLTDSLGSSFLPLYGNRYCNHPN